MKWKTAMELCAQISRYCRYPLTVALKATNHRSPPLDSDAGVMCMEKVRRDMNPHWCEPECPEGE